MRGRVLTSSYGTYAVEGEGAVYACKPRGIFRLKGEKPIVGDEVEFDPLQLTIDVLYERKNMLIRPAIANLDQLIIIHSCVEPTYSSRLIDKFLTYANLSGIPATVILSKIDKVKDRTEIEKQKKSFAKLGVYVIFFSKTTGEGIPEIEALFQGKITGLMGQTGVGKSSLMNTLVPSYQRKIGDYSRALGRGKHQTKEVALLPYGSGYIADTPGFSSLELNLVKEEAAKFFPGFPNLATHCKYLDCLHLNEKECAVKKALAENIIDQESYDNYLAILAELPYRKERY